MPSTQAPPSFSSGALAAASAGAAAVEAALLAALGEAGPGAEAGAAIALPGGISVRLGRLPAAAELRRLRRDFERLSTTDAVLGGARGAAGAGAEAAGERFARYLESVLRGP
jgi:hypothetical protein